MFLRMVGEYGPKLWSCVIVEAGDVYWGGKTITIAPVFSVHRKR